MKQLLSFEFRQKFGKTLLVVVAVMPAAGLMISIGKIFAMFDIAFFTRVGVVIINHKTSPVGVIYRHVLLF